MDYARYSVKICIYTNPLLSAIKTKYLELVLYVYLKWKRKLFGFAWFENK